MNPKIPSELTIEIEGIPPIKLKTSGRLSFGRNTLSDIKWYSYLIEDPAQAGLDYDCVAVSFSQITIKILEEAQNNIFLSGVSKGKGANIDANSGNIHPDMDTVASNSSREIKQLVLCSGKGPLMPKFIETDEYYFYSAVHKACYYPPINNKDEEKFKNDFRQVFLKKIWEQLTGVD